MRMKKIRLLFLTLVALMGGVVSSSGKTVYIQPNSWSDANAVISLWVWGGSNSGSWWTASNTFTEVESGVFKATLDEEITGMKITRGKVGNTWDSGDDAKWNETGNIDIVDGKLYKATGYDNGTMIYTVEDYTEPVAAGYTVDFNTAISTGSHDFSVASNWGHIVGTNNYDNYGPYYMSYGYSSTGGVDDTGALRVGAQNGYFSGSPQSGADFTDGNYDYLITPKVNGAITLQVKRYAVTGYSSYVKIFAVNEAGTTVGTEIATTLSGDINESDWVTLSLTLTEEQRLAIRAQAVLLDNFTAESANIQKMPAMTISSISRADGGSTTYFDMNADGTYNVQYKVKITNSGEVDLKAGTTENYSLSVSIDGTTYGSFDVPVDLAVGETSDEFLASIVVPDDAPTGWKNRYLVENLTGTKNTASLTWSNTIAYNPVPYFIKQGDEPNSKGATLTNVTALDFGMISEATTLNYEIFAHNAGNLEIKSITAPEGFAVAPAETLPYTIEAHSGMNVDVTASGTATASGVMVITYVGVDGNDATMEVTLRQTVIDASKWIATFDDNTWPANTIHQSSLSISNSTYSNIKYAVYSDYSYSNKFFTPLLTATAGEKFKFDARLGSSSGSVKVFVTKDRSTLGDAVLTLSSSQLNTSEFSAQELTIDEAGDYYIVFEIYKAYIDNLYGLEKKAVDHDIMVNAYKIGYYAEDKEIQSGDSQSFSLEILPVQAETADAYSVKLYANGEAVASAESVNLTAGTTKTFSFTYAPVVTTNTTFETYAQVEFTDGTIVKSPSLNLTVKCEPIFVFFNAGTAVYSYQPSNRSTAITFGKVNEVGLVQNFEIYNYGKANLTVKSITVPEGFSVNVSEATVAPAERQAVDITFSATEIGSYEGNLTIVYVDVDGADQTFTLPVSGTLLDPNKFYATFGTSSDASNYPAGSLAQANVSITTPTTNNGALVSSYSTKNLFITPKLVTTGENVQFDAKVRSSYYTGSVKVYSVTDNVAAAETTTDAEFEALAPTLLGEFTIGTDVSNFTTYSLEAPAGEYYLAFKIADVQVDEIYGMTIVPVAHDWMIASSNIPAEAMQNVASTATVNILNLGLADEAADSYTVTAFVNGEAAGTGTAVALPMSHKLSDAGTQLSVSYLSTKKGTFPVYLEVKAGAYSVTTDPVDVVFAEEVASGDVATGTSAGTDSTTPLNLYYKNSETIALYTQANLGLSGGEKINSITWKGYTTSSHTSTLKVYYQWTDATTIAAPSSTGNYDVTGMTAAIEPTSKTWTVGGSADNLQDQIVVNFTTPITYENGKSLLILVSSSASGYSSSSTAIQFEKSTTTGYAYQHQNDGTEGTFTGSWSAKNLPLIHIGVEVEDITLSGTVKTSAGAGIEGATITLKAENGVEYSGTTDAEGNYSINVIQAGLDFTATVEATDYLKRQFALNMNGASATNDVTMYKQFGIVGSLPGLSWDNDVVMTQSVDDPNIFTAELNNVSVTAGDFKYKLRADGAWKSDLAGEGYELPASGDYNWTISTSGTYNFKFTFDWTNHTLTFERPFTLSETADGIAALNWVDVTVEREFKAGWNAVVLPFGLDDPEFVAAFGANSEVAVYDGDTNDNGNVTVKFKKQDATYKWIEAGVPYLIWLEQPVSGLKFTKDISADLTTVEGTTFDFVGTYTTADANAGDYFIAGGKFVKATTNNTVKPFRAYLKLKAGQTAARSLTFVVGNEEVTAIEGLSVERDYTNDAIYNLNGQKLQQPTKRGLYIINGKKVMVK